MYNRRNTNTTPRVAEFCISFESSEQNILGWGNFDFWGKSGKCRGGKTRVWSVFVVYVCTELSKVVGWQWQWRRGIPSRRGDRSPRHATCCVRDDNGCIGAGTQTTIDTRVRDFQHCSNTIHYSILYSNKEYVWATTLSFQGHVTSPVTWPFDLPYAIS